MKISCNVKQGTSLVKNSSQTVEIKNKTKGTSLVKNSSQTVEIKDKTNEKSHIYNKIYLTIN